MWEGVKIYNEYDNSYDIFWDHHLRCQLIHDFQIYYFLLFLYLSMDMEH